MKKHYGHQKEIVAEDRTKAGIFLGTGTGKTLICLMLARGSTLVICPKTQKEDKNWEREYMDNLPFLKIRTFDVISKEEFRRDHEKLPRYDTVIVDEAHTCLGVTPNVRQRKKVIIPKASQLFEGLQAYIARTNPERFYLATATIMRSPMTVWGAATLLGNDWNFYEFRSAFYTKLPMPGREAWAPKKASHVKDRLAQAVRNIGYVGRLDDFFDVPQQTFKTVHIELTEKQKTRIAEIEEECPDPSEKHRKIHQIQNGILLPDEFSTLEIFDNGKIDYILDLLVEYPRLLIFARYREQISQIEAAVKKAGIAALTMTGDTKERGEVIRQADGMEECAFIVQSQISAGWELKNYRCAVFASYTGSFVDYAQAIGRIHRANNLQKNLYIDLVAKGKGPDQDMHDCMKNKVDYDERIYKGPNEN